MKAAIQGYEGCFHEIVARSYFGQGVETVPCATFREVASQVASGKCEYGVMAIENSIAGSIIANYSILQNSSLQVAGEAYLRIEQNLMALPGTKLDEIREVHSHPMAFLQCIDFLDSHRWKLVETEDTALSARRIAEKNLEGIAGIAGRLAAQLFGLEIIAPAINTIQHNYTRFMILKRHDHYIDPQADKASLYFKTSHTHGSLFQVLKQMEDSMINMTKLQSYPIPEEPWHYLFHVDMEFECLDDYIRTLDKLQNTAHEVHVYGVYKKGVNTGI
ncbi:MAG: prephenate dehydratase [Rikenellaceae bacterium]|nr:prephenate dehydratase [Rikenellaceae bacterium]